MPYKLYVLLIGVLMVTILVSIASCSDVKIPFTSDKWMATVYPDKNDLTIHRNLGEYNSLNACRDAIYTYMQDMNILETGDYECGKNCRQKSGMSFYICEETLH